MSELHAMHANREFIRLQVKLLNWRWQMQTADFRQ